MKTYYAVAEGYPVVDGVITPELLFGTTERVTRRGFDLQTEKTVFGIDFFKDLEKYVNENRSFHTTFLSLEVNEHKKITYSVKLNRLRVYDYGDLVYQNWDGVIDNDPVALADSYE